MDPNRACHAQRQKPSIFGTSYGPGRQVQTAPIPFKFQPNQVHTHRLVEFHGFRITLNRLGTVHPRSWLNFITNFDEFPIVNH